MLSRELGTEVIVAAMRDESLVNRELPKVGDHWKVEPDEIRVVDHVGPTHVGYEIENGVRNLVTHAQWRRWQKRAVLAHREEKS